MIDYHLYCEIRRLHRQRVIWGHVSTFDISILLNVDCREPTLDPFQPFSFFPTTSIKSLFTISIWSVTANPFFPGTVGAVLGLYAVTSGTAGAMVGLWIHD